MRAFVTGAAGFIGSHVVEQLLMTGWNVLGYDNLSDYYSVSAKQERLSNFSVHSKFRVIVGALEDSNKLHAAVTDFQPDVVIHLAAQAGVRHSVDYPTVHLNSNIIGTCNLLEAIKGSSCSHVILASSSSVYGDTRDLPYYEASVTDRPLSVYAASKKSVELISHAYSHLFSIPTTCVRLFTVYGPGIRPDLAIFRFIEAINADLPVEVFGSGLQRRDFTHVSDVSQAVLLLLAATPSLVGSSRSALSTLDTLSSVAPWRVLNIGAGRSVGVLEVISMIEQILGKPANIRFCDRQAGDVMETSSDCQLLQQLTGFTPQKSLEVGLREVIHWYLDQNLPSGAMLAREGVQAW